MAVSLLSHVVSDLCLGKPPVRSLSVAATVEEALVAIKTSQESFISVWSCNHNNKTETCEVYDDEDDEYECECVGKISMVDVICYLCKDDKNLLSPSTALKAPVSVLLPETFAHIVHVEPSCSLLKAIDLIVQGAQNLVVPIQTKPVTRRRQNKLQSQDCDVSLTTIHKHGRQFCWLTQEDIIRFLLGSIGLFSPLPALSVADLGIVSHTHSVLAVDYSSAGSAALPAIFRALAEQSSVAVVDGGEGEDGTVLIGEISPSTLACCDETAAAAVATLSAGDLMAYIDCGGPPEGLVRVVKARLEENGFVGMLLHFDSFSSSSSSSSSSPSGSSSDEESTARSAKRSGRSVSYSARMERRSEAIVCHPKSSLMAVMIRAITHRVNYVWVIEQDCSLVGIVTFVDILKVLRDHLEKMF